MKREWLSGILVECGVLAEISSKSCHSMKTFHWKQPAALSLEVSSRVRLACEQFNITVILCFESTASINYLFWRHMFTLHVQLSSLLLLTLWSFNNIYHIRCVEYNWTYYQESAFVCLLSDRALLFLTHTTVPSWNFQPRTTCFTHNNCNFLIYQCN